MRAWAAALATALICAAPTTALASGGGEAVPYETIARGAYTGYRTRAEERSVIDDDEVEFAAPSQRHEFLVIDNEASWKAFWAAHARGAKAPVIAAAEGGSSDAPKVDFEDKLVVAIFAGRQVMSLEDATAVQDGGKKRGIQVVALSREGHEGLAVSYQDYTSKVGEPKLDQPRTAVNPFHIVVCDRVNGTVRFVDRPSHHLEPWVTMLFGIILVLMILALALEEKIHAKKSIITGAFAIVTMFLGDAFGFLPIGAVTNVFEEGIAIPIYITAVDWEVIAIILASSIFVDVTSKSGIFTWIAIKLTKQSGGDPLRLLIYYGAMTVVFSAVLNNVTAMIIVGSLTGVSLRKLKRTNLLLGFLLIEGLLTNVGGLLTLISSVPNIIVGNTAGIGFATFFIIAAPYVILATMVTLVMGARIYKIKPLTTAEERAESASQVAGFDENDGIESPAFFKFSAVIFGLFILVLALTSELPVLRDLKMGYVAFAFATLMLLLYRSEVDRFYAKVDWDLIGFFASLFIVINVMEHAGVLHAIGGVIGKLTALGANGGGAALLWSSAVASSVTDNIPLAAMLAKILDAQGTSGESNFWWSVIFGANLGGNVTPIGSASTVVAVTVMAKNDLAMSFGAFVKAAVPFAVVQLILASFYVLTIALFPVWWGIGLVALAVAITRLRAQGGDDEPAESKT